MLPAIFGIEGLTLSSAEKKIFSEHKPHGIILFKRNCESREQISALTNEIKSTIGLECKIFIDQEGGRVARIRPPIAEKEFPNMEFFGKLYNEKGKDQAVKAVEQNFFELMSELKSLGIDVTAAPVCDLRYTGAHDVIGDRSFSENPQIVIDLASAALEGINRAGGEGIIKHIPGHGRSICDSHKELPYIDASLEELEETDFIVFKALAQKCPYAMTAHIIYKCLDPDNTVTMSRKAIKYIRDHIGFKGMLMSDDIDMKALVGDTATKTQNILDAGCDIVLQCSGNINDIEKVVSVFIHRPSSPGRT